MARATAGVLNVKANFITAGGDSVHGELSVF